MSKETLFYIDSNQNEFTLLNNENNKECKLNIITPTDENFQNFFEYVIQSVIDNSKKETNFIANEITLSDYKVDPSRSADKHRELLLEFKIYLENEISNIVNDVHKLMIDKEFLE